MGECSSVEMQDTAVIWQIAIINSRAEEESEGLLRSGSRTSDKVTKVMRTVKFVGT
jgi:uncharacterized membrane protein